jgi:hypothetical protein
MLEGEVRKLVYEDVDYKYSNAYNVLESSTRNIFILRIGIILK